MGKLRAEEKIGLALAVVLHVAVLSAFLLHPAAHTPPPPQPISVTLSRDAGLNATAPTHEDAAADIAPTLGTPPPAPTPPAPTPVVSPAPARVETPPVEKPVPAPRPVTVTRPKPEPVKPLPAPVPARHVVKPEEPVAAPAPAKPAQISASAPAKPAHRHAPSVSDWALTMPATPDHQPPGGSRIGNDFAKGISGGKASGKAQQQGAAVIGPEVKSALSGAIARQLKPHWVAPQGVDADKLVTFLSWDLNPDGTLAGEPHVVRQEGITDSNRPQAARHAEQAIRAVELAAPFSLPPQYYSLWKHVGLSRFDRTLSQ